MMLTTLIVMIVLSNPRVFHASFWPKLNNLNKHLSNKPTMRVLAGGAALWSRYNAAAVDNGGDHTGDGDYFISL